MSENNEEPAITRRSSHVVPPEGEVVPPPVPPRHPVPVPGSALDSASSDARRPASASPVARRRWLLPTVVGVLGLALGALLGATIASGVIAAQQAAAAEAAETAAEESKSEFFEDAARRCGLSGVVEVADKGSTMIVDGEGEDLGSGDVDFTALECIIDAVDTPAAVKELMFSTRSLDGRQSGDWDDVSAGWGYHPDDGLDIIFELE